MQILSQHDILDIGAYERVRADYRRRMIAHKKLRRIPVGPQMSLVFEDRETLRYQIQEMTRVERTTDRDKVQIEIDVYNELMPRENELSATLFIEIPELDQIQPALDRLVGIDEHVAIVVADHDPVRAIFDARQMEEDRISAVHYIRFALTPEQSARFANGDPPRITIDHPHYRHETVIEPVTRDSLSGDLRGEAPSFLDPDSIRDSSPAGPETLVEVDRVRARRTSANGAPERVIVEPIAGHTSLIDADPALLAALFALAQQVAGELAGRTGGSRVQLDLQANEPGGLRLEISAQPRRGSR